MKKFRSTVAQIELKSGMAYVIQLDDGRFLLIDGGDKFGADGERLYKYLSEKAEGEKPVIAAWFFSHGHRDHIRLAYRFMEEYAKCVEIQRIAYNIPLNVEYGGYDKTSGVNDEQEEQMWYKTIENFPDAEKRVLKTGDVFTFANARVDVLSTAFDPYPASPTNRNETSAIFKVSFDSEKSFMVLGDAMSDRLAALIDCNSTIYCSDDILKSDILQVAHHGLCVCRKEQYEAVTQLYKKIAPKICFWPTSARRFYNDTWCQSEEYPYNQFLLTSAKEKNFHQ